MDGTVGVARKGEGMSALLVERGSLELLVEAMRTIRSLAADGHITQQDADALCVEAFEAWVEANRKDQA